MTQNFRTNLTNVAVNYLQQLNVPVTKTTFKESLEQNPYYPSLYCLRNTFDKFNIGNFSFMVTTEDLKELQTPFITYCNGQSTGKDFILVTKITDSVISYIAENNKPTQVSKEHFLKTWQKAVFAAEA